MYTFNTTPSIFISYFSNRINVQQNSCNKQYRN